MSKIQKALDAIASKAKNDASNEGSAVKAERYLKRFGPNVSDPEVVSVPKKITPAPLNIDNLVPQVKIDLDRLNQAGMWQTGNDAEVIREQFRRAKRPVIANAFREDGEEDAYRSVALITSAMPGAGKSFCAANLARSIGRERDVGVVLVDGDVLKSSITRGFGLEDRTGLLDYLQDDSLEMRDIVVPTDVSDIFVVPSGAQHAESAELLASQRMGVLMSTLSTAFAHCIIVVDTPPMLVTNEAHILSSYAGQIIVVIAARKTSQGAVLQALGSLDRRKPINAILNKSPAASATGKVGDAYGYYPFPGESHERG